MNRALLTMAPSKPEDREVFFNLFNIPTPDLSPEEELLPADQKELRVIVKKCANLGTFGVVDVDTLSLLVDCSADKDYSEKEGEVILQNGDSPESFHLMWFKNSDRGYLMNRWLTDNINDFDTIPSTSIIHAGTMVAAFFGADGYWYRATVLDNIDETFVRVQFIDYGNVDKIPLNYMRVLPQRLAELPPLSFCARLAKLYPDGKKMELDKDTNVAFLRMATDSPALKARLKDYDGQGSVWNVYLWRGPKPLEELNKNIREILRKIRDTPKPPPGEVPKTDLIQMIHLNHEVNIREYRELSFKGLRNYRVSFIVNPSEFFVECVIDPISKYTSEVRWQELMQGFYNEEKNAHKYRLRTSRVYVNRCYAWKNPDTSRWERVRVVSVSVEQRTCEIHVVDIGYFTEVNFVEIYELCVKFASASAAACSAFLVDIAPPRGTSNEWPEKSIEGFSNLVEGKVFHGIVISRETLDYGLPETTMKLGLILMDRDELAKNTLNAQLAKLGLAEPTGLASGRTDLSSEIAGSPHFNTGDFKRFLEREGKDTTNVVQLSPTLSPLLSGIHPKNENANLTGNPAFYLTWLRNRDKKYEDLEHMPLMIRRRLGVCTILRIASPGCFYIQLAEKFPELEQMMSNIRVQVENTAPMDTNDIMDGSFVAVKLNDEREGSHWHRGIIKQHLSKIRMIKVILVDFGMETRTRREHIRPLPTFFTTISSFCQRVHLDAHNLNPLGSFTWTQGAKDAFRRYVSCWESQIPVYYYWQPKNAAIIELDEFDQAVRFNPKLEKWEKGDFHDIPYERHIGKIKKHVMLYNLFCSVGVDIAYEIFTNVNEEYRFANIWDLLKTLGFAIARKDKKHVNPSMPNLGCGSPLLPTVWKHPENPEGEEE